MKNSSGYCVVLLSPPSRWSGLKYPRKPKEDGGRYVSTLAVEWIEIHLFTRHQREGVCLHPRGGVD